MYEWNLNPPISQNSKSLYLTYISSVLIFTDESSSLFGCCPTSAGVKGTLSESEGYILANLVVTASAILLTVYFLVWQTYVMRIDVIVSSVLLVAFGVDGLLAVGALTRLARLDSVTLVVIVDSRGAEKPLVKCPTVLLS